MLPVGDAWKAQAAEVFEGREAFPPHVLEQAVGHVFNDAVAEVHGRGADLDVAAAEQDELGSVLPGGDAADAGEG